MRARAVVRRAVALVVRFTMAFVVAGLRLVVVLAGMYPPLSGKSPAEERITDRFGRQILTSGKSDYRTSGVLRSLAQHRKEAMDQAAKITLFVGAWTGFFAGISAMYWIGALTGACH